MNATVTETGRVQADQFARLASQARLHAPCRARFGKLVPTGPADSALKRNGELC